MASGGSPACWSVAGSLDGFIATAGASLEWLIHLGHVNDAGLVGEAIVRVGSVTLGTGKPLLPAQIAFPPLRRMSARAIGTGFAGLRDAVQRRH